MKRVLVETNRYFDSVFLMRISREIESLDGVRQAVVAMATPANVDNIAGAGFALEESARPILPNDVVIALDAETEEAFAAAKDRLEILLAGSTDDEAAIDRPESLREALEVDPEANVAVISVPGEYAAREARQALRQGLHVMLFSDNVSVDDEIALKQEAIERGLLMMGPDCGTAILNGVPLGFANACRRGSIGIVGASGTGIQEISSLIHTFGGGISQAIGTGGRDLSSAVGAAMTRFGIEALAGDPQTDVIVVVSKTPAPEVALSVIDTQAAAGKTGVIHFVGAPEREAHDQIRFAGTLEQAAVLACEAAGLEVSLLGATADTAVRVSGSILGLYCGGTLCQEAWSLMDRAGIDVHSNVASHPEKKVHPEAQVVGHAVWDLGDDVFTVGRPHPMIEPSLRDERVERAGNDPDVGIVLVDCVIGYGAHDDPARSLGEAAGYAFASAKAGGRDLRIIASVTGTDLDPQNATRQRKTLEDAGVLVAASNAGAVRLASALVEGASS
ncbi:acyl-CoA synthetase FdrA [Candidatus Bipolaricaulota bacterium]